MIRKALKAVLVWHPFAVLALYAFLIADFYREKLDHSFKVIPEPGSAPEDMLAIAFLWPPVIIWFVLTCIFLAVGRIRSWRYWVAFIGIFIVLNAINLVLFNILEPQVIARSGVVVTQPPVGEPNGRQ